MKENSLDGDGNPHAWIDYMERDIPLLLSCEGIYLLPTWKDSKGARIEKVIAEHSKMLIVTHGFQGKRGEVLSANNEKLITKSERPEHCGFCGRKLSENEIHIEVDRCFRCQHRISSVSGVGIQSAARV